MSGNPRIPAAILGISLALGIATQQFAADSGSRVGGIRTALQGCFSISDRDPFSPEFKSVRVVTMVEYFLVD